MPQLHLYVPEEVAAAVEQRAKERGISVSKYLSELVRREIHSGWPDGFFENVVGAWKGEPLSRGAQGSFERRDDL